MYRGVNTRIFQHAFFNIEETLTNREASWIAQLFTQASYEFNKRSGQKSRNSILKVNDWKQVVGRKWESEPKTIPLFPNLIKYAIFAKYNDLPISRFSQFKILFFYKASLNIQKKTPNFCQCVEIPPPPPPQDSEMRKPGKMVDHLLV